MEILNDLIEKQEKLEKQFLVIEELLKKQLARPLPTADTASIGRELKNHLGDPSLKIREAEEKISRAIEKIPTSVKIENEFYGFANFKSALLFFSTLVFISLVLGGLYIHEKQRADEKESLANSYKNDFIKVEKQNPKLAKKFLEIVREN